MRELIFMKDNDSSSYSSFSPKKQSYSRLSSYEKVPEQVDKDAENNFEICFQTGSQNQKCSYFKQTPTTEKLVISEQKQGGWEKEEHSRFLQALLKYGNQWNEVEKFIGTRTGRQAKSHAQKFLEKVRNTEYFKRNIGNNICVSSLHAKAKLLSQAENDTLLEKLGEVEYERSAKYNVTTKGSEVGIGKGLKINIDSLCKSKTAKNKPPSFWLRDEPKTCPLDISLCFTSSRDTSIVKQYSSSISLNNSTFDGTDVFSFKDFTSFSIAKSSKDSGVRDHVPCFVDDLASIIADPDTSINNTFDLFSTDKAEDFSSMKRNDNSPPSGQSYDCTSFLDDDRSFVSKKRSRRKLSSDDFEFKMELSSIDCSEGAKNFDFNYSLEAQEFLRDGNGNEWNPKGIFTKFDFDCDWERESDPGFKFENTHENKDTEMTLDPIEPNSASTRESGLLDNMSFSFEQSERPFLKDCDFRYFFSTKKLTPCSLKKKDPSVTVSTDTDISQQLLSTKKNLLGLFSDCDSHFSKKRGKAKKPQTTQSSYKLSKIEKLNHVHPNKRETKQNSSKDAVLNGLLDGVNSNRKKHVKLFSIEKVVDTGLKPAVELV